MAAVLFLDTSLLADRAAIPDVHGHRDSLRMTSLWLGLARARLLARKVASWEAAAPGKCAALTPKRRFQLGAQSDNLEDFGK